MTILVLLLAVNAILHVLIVYRFGAKENVAFLVYAVIDAALAIGVFLGAPYVLWPTLILTAIGFVGQIVQLNRLNGTKRSIGRLRRQTARRCFAHFISCSQNRAHEKDSAPCGGARSIQRVAA